MTKDLLEDSECIGALERDDAPMPAFRPHYLRFPALAPTIY